MPFVGPLVYIQVPTKIQENKTTMPEAADDDRKTVIKT